MSKHVGRNQREEWALRLLKLLLTPQGKALLEAMVRCEFRMTCILPKDPPDDLEKCVKLLSGQDNGAETSAEEPMAPACSLARPRPEETPRNEFLSQHKNEIVHVGREFRLVGRTGARHVVGIRTVGFREDVPAHPARCWFPTSLVTPFHHRWRTRSSAAVPVTFDGMPQDPDQPNRVKVDTH